MKKNFRTTAKVTLVLVYFVIIAGALVRMTGSGMGCPDWPKCFGYYIPPTDIKELTWEPNREFEEGQVIIKDEALLVATEDFTTGKEFNPQNWRPYTKHDYAIFNPTHTWIEYLNRLAGALAGIATFAMALLSLGYWRSNKRITLLSWLTVVLMGIQGWLGATVVYSVLNPFKITLHMLVALVIVAVILYIIHKSGFHERTAGNDSGLKILLLGALLLSLVQILLGTQVRQFVDEQSKMSGTMANIFESPTIAFYIHRTFSILVFLVNGFIFWKGRKVAAISNRVQWVLLLIFSEIVSGVVMYYFDFPFGLQTTHLILAALLFGLQFYLWLDVKSSQKHS